MMKILISFVVLANDDLILIITCRMIHPAVVGSLYCYMAISTCIFTDTITNITVPQSKNSVIAKSSITWNNILPLVLCIAAPTIEIQF